MILYQLKGDNCFYCKEVKERLEKEGLTVLRVEKEDICPTLSWHGEGQMGILMGYTNIMMYFRPLRRGVV